MPIDDPGGIAIRQAREEIEAESYLPSQLIKLGLSAVTAAALAGFPFVAQIINNLLTNSSTRSQERLLRVAEALDAQQKRIEDHITDKSYYESEEFQTLLGLIIERLHTTHDQEKLRRFGLALANSGSSEFQSDDKEEFVRVLRDLSAKDLQVLDHNYLKGWFPHTHTIEYEPDILISLSRLVGMGLVLERYRRPFPQSVSPDPAPLTELPKRCYSLSPLGGRFLKFIQDGPTTETS